MSDFQQTMLEQAIAIQQNAYAPYSNFYVGVCIRTEDDALFAGCNVENASFGLTQCAEATAIGLMIANGKKIIKEVVVIGSGKGLCPPCGACRQRFREFAALDTPIHLADKNGIQTTETLEALLPLSFGPDNLTK